MNRALAESGQVLSNNDVVVLIEPRYVDLKTAGQMYGNLSADCIADLQDLDEDPLPIVRIGRRRLVPIGPADAWFAARIKQGSAA